MKNLQKQVMRRVYFAWVLRRTIRNSAKLAIIGGLAWIVKGDIWYARVWENISRVDFAPRPLLSYASSAISGAEGMVQLAAVVAAGCIGFFIHDIVRSAKTIAFERVK